VSYKPDNFIGRHNALYKRASGDDDGEPL